MHCQVMLMTMRSLLELVILDIVGVVFTWDYPNFCCLVIFRVLRVQENRSLKEECSEWSEWQTTALPDHNMVENVYRWACGRPTALQHRTRDSDDDDIHDRDYDVAALANNLSQAFRYNLYDNDEGEEANIAMETLQVFAPLAKLLGMYQIKSELENLSFMYTNPQDYAKVKRRIAELSKE